jgi:cytochrome b6-f complex iron-sulfur subunit
MGSQAPGEHEDCARRRLIQVLLGGGLVASVVSFLYPVLRYLIPPPAADLGAETTVAAHVGELKPNSGMIFPFAGRPAILILTSDGQYHALSAVCTHLGCTVQYRPDLKEIWCPCHNGTYDINGRNISGPPPRPLTVFDVNLQGNDIVVSRRG